MLVNVGCITLKVTGTVLDRPFAVLMLIAPVRLPAESPITFAPTVSVFGVDPVAGATVNQDPPLEVAVNVVTGFALIVKACAEGDDPPV